MNCKDVKNLIEDFIENNINEEIKKEINHHMSQCMDCKNEYNLAKSSIEALSNAKAIAPPEDMWKKVNKKILERQSKPSGFFIKPILLPAALCTFIICFISLFCINNYRNNLILQEKMAETHYITGLKYEKENNLSKAAEEYSKVIDNYRYEKFYFIEDLSVRLKVCEIILSKQEAMLAVRGNEEQKYPHKDNLEKISNIIGKLFPDKEKIKLKEEELMKEKNLND
jgi:hypothetical protein